MADKKQLGLYWGTDSFCIVEASKNKATQVIHIPFSTPIDAAQASAGGSGAVPEDLKFTALIKKALTENNIKSNLINLSLPAKDLIFRSFTIPWMQADEVGNVVEFEATKYIPINLEDLQFTYHPVTLTENKQKNLLIGFVAVRKSILGRYKSILEASGLELNHIEPAPVSMTRLLQQNGQIAKWHSTAIIEIGRSGVKIIILGNEVVQFVREFPLTDDPANTEAFRTKFFNDVRVSFDFYKRQHPKGSLDKIVAVSQTDLTELVKGLGEELKLPATFVQTTQLLKDEQAKNIGFLPAFGIAIRDKKFSSKNLDLSDKSDGARMVGSIFENINVKLLGGVLSACVLIIAGTVYLSDQMVVGNRNRLAELRGKQGIFKSSNSTQITELKNEREKKLNSYKAIRTQSDISFLLSRVPELMPEGTWLRSLKILYENTPGKIDTKIPEKLPMEITLEGYAYLENSNEQFRLVNTLVGRLKSEEGLMDRFDNINLATVNQTKLEQEYTVTFFKINCSTGK